MTEPDFNGSVTVTAQIVDKRSVEKTAGTTSAGGSAKGAGVAAPMVPPLSLRDGGKIQTVGVTVTKTVKLTGRGPHRVTFPFGASVLAVGDGTVRFAAEVATTGKASNGKASNDAVEATVPVLSVSGDMQVATSMALQVRYIVALHLPCIGHCVSVINYY